ncbi:MAG TPA: hypothetical protein VH136_18750 [Trebonia sp.]|jgi:hypothetical protein|nr:hypothetical protein [Trebonia sp.]
MTTPSGLLAWGQAGEYNAVDDRSVITALANTRNGVVIAAALSAGSGLVVNIASGWLAVANCGDGTCAVIGSRVAQSVTVPAGPSSGSLTSYIWADVNPDSALYTVNVITPAQAAGRSGVLLGTVIANAGNNTSASMTLTSAAPSFATVDGVNIATVETGGAAYLYATKSGMLYVESRNPPAAAGTLVCSLQDGLHRSAATATDGVSITPKWTIQQADMVAWSHYRLWTSGVGHAPNPAAAFWFDVSLNGVGFARVTFPSGTYPAGTTFNFWCEAHAQLDTGAVNAFVTIKVDLTAASLGSYTTVASIINQPIPKSASFMVVRTNLAQVTGGSADTWSSVFQRDGGQDPTAQITP